MRQAYGLLPRVKITELLLEVDGWTGFARHFTHIKSGEPANDKTLLLTTILADAINLGLNKMAESCPGTTYAKLSWLQAWHVRDETYSAALGDLVNSQFRQPFAIHWGDGTTSSSDGQRFKAGGRAEAGGNINPKYGSEPYDVSKAALNHLIRELAMRFGPRGARVNAIAPATLVSGSAMFPRDRVIVSLEKYAIPFSHDDSTETLRSKLGTPSWRRSWNRTRRARFRC
jgi:NAD(P)-dependent dehydrogenase (short-subunit alcohol dehydrogenase family)